MCELLSKETSTATARLAGARHGEFRSPG